jgi:hypothetical protein
MLAQAVQDLFTVVAVAVAVPLKTALTLAQAVTAQPVLSWSLLTSHVHLPPSSHYNPQ